MEGALLFDVKAAESLKHGHRPQLRHTNDPALISNLKTKYWVYFGTAPALVSRTFERNDTFFRR